MHCTVIFAENAPKHEYNRLKLDELQHPPILIKTIDKILSGTPSNVIQKLRMKSQSSTAGLAYKLVLKKGAKVMLTVNIDIDDRLINGQMGIVYDFAYSDSVITKIYAKFYDVKASFRLR